VCPGNNCPPKLHVKGGKKMEVNELFYGETKKDHIVNQESMVRFVDAIRGEIDKGLMAEDMDDPPLTLYIVTTCPECEEYHLVGSKVLVEDENGKEIMLKSMPPEHIMRKY
jgi:hypothetical protein